jgi:hypothetical protein
MMEKISVTIQLMNTVLQYLSTRPYHEVHQLIEAIQKEAKAQLVPEAVEDDENSF